MGGTTAKICLIDDGEPQHSRTFEVARQYRFLKGSGLPLRIPVIEMVEIGAGGGSIASVDSLSRVNVGPESAGAEPGPASYGRGGTEPTVTDADVVLGRIDPGYFAGGIDQALARQGRRGRRQGGRHAARPEAPRRGLRRQRDRRGEHGQCRPRARRRARQGAAGPHHDRLRRRGAHPCRAAGRKARHPPRPGAERRGRGLGGRLPDGAGRLRGRAQPLRPARRRQVRPGLRQRAVRRDARRGRGRGQGGRARRQAGRDAHRRHALSRPGPRDHRRPAAPARSTAPRATKLLQALRGRLRRDLRPDHPGPRRRDHELDAAAGGRAGGRCPRSRRSPPTSRPRRAAAGRSTIRPIRT